MIDEAAKGWMAGILDFQAHICDKANKTRATPQLTMYVETKTLEIIGRLCEMTGISYRDRDSGFREEKEWMRRGCADHCPEAHVHSITSVLPPMGRWEITGTSMAAILWNLRKYMVTGREAWDWAMGQGLANARLSGRGATQTVASLRRLAGLGWEMPPVLEGAVTEGRKAISA